MQLEHRLSALLQLNFILDLTPGFIVLGKDNCKTKLETFKFAATYIRDFTVHVSVKCFPCPAVFVPNVFSC